MISEEQRKERINYIGSSDSAAILGLSRYKTPLSVWAEKTGVIQPEDISDKLAVKLGNKMEQIVAELFEEETGKRLVRVNETIYHKKFPFLACNLDRRVVGESAIVEIKTAASWRQKEFMGEEIPEEHIVQVFHQLAVTGLPKAYLVVLIGNHDFVIKEIPRDEKVLADLIERERDFWQRFVVPKAIPDIVTRYDNDTLTAIFPEAKIDSEIALGDDANQLIELLDSLKKDYKHIEGMIALNENRLKLMIKANEIGSTGIYQVFWSNSKWAGLDGKKLKSELPDIHAKYFVTKPTRRFFYNKINNKGE